jgi:glycosyltransferase involved in cell wall biosynthesis
MKTICIDARLYGISHTGIGRYVGNLIKYLPPDPYTKVILIVSNSDQDNPELSKFEKIIARFHPYAIPAQFEMLWIWWKVKPDLLHATHSSIPALWPGRLVVTFHDLIRHQSKGHGTTTRKYFLYWFKYFGYLIVDMIAMWRAAIIIVPAKYWKDILIRDYHLPKSKIKVTYEGVDQAISKSKTSVVDFGDISPYVVYTGNVYPHKNIPVLLQAIKLLNGRMHLVLVGARSVFTGRIGDLTAKFGISEYVKLLGKLPDEQLASLYKGALAFVFPSLIEGFGLTGLEAMAVGLPVIAARASCLPEIYEDSAMYFDPHNPQDLADKITQLNNNFGLRSRFVKKGLLQVKKYSWVKMSQETWQIYQNVLH